MYNYGGCEMNAVETQLPSVVYCPPVRALRSYVGQPVCLGRWWPGARTPTNTTTYSIVRMRYVPKGVNENRTAGNIGSTENTEEE
jgi:hypothetical protein